MLQNGVRCQQQREEAENKLFFFSPTRAFPLALCMDVRVKACGHCPSPCLPLVPLVYLTEPAAVQIMPHVLVRGSSHMITVNLL